MIKWIKICNVTTLNFICNMHLYFDKKDGIHSVQLILILWRGNYDELEHNRQPTDRKVTLGLQKSSASTNVRAGHDRSWRGEWNSLVIIHWLSYVLRSKVSPERSFRENQYYSRHAMGLWIIFRLTWSFSLTIGFWMRAPGDWWCCIPQWLLSWIGASLLEMHLTATWEWERPLAD